MLAHSLLCQDALWNVPPQDLQLGPQEVHTWSAGLNLPLPRVCELFELLSPDERERAERFYFARDKRRFIVCRAVLRMIVSRYLQVDPRSLTFGYTLHGKPFLIKESARDTLEFNLSHSEEQSLYGFVRGRAIGVDVEYRRAREDVQGIATSFFSPSESATLEGLRAEEKLDAFISCWTRKEAYLKATGAGLSMPLDAFEVSFVQGEPARILKTRADDQEAARWSLHALDLGPRYLGALAVEGHDLEYKYWRWTE